MCTRTCCSFSRAVIALFSSAHLLKSLVSIDSSRRLLVPFTSTATSSVVRKTVLHCSRRCFRVWAAFAAERCRVPVSVDLLIQGLEFDRWVVVSMMLMCNAIVIIEHDRRSGFRSAALDMEYDNSSVDYLSSKHNPYSRTAFTLFFLRTCSKMLQGKFLC